MDDYYGFGVNLNFREIQKLLIIFQKNIIFSCQVCFVLIRRPWSGSHLNSEMYTSCHRNNEHSKMNQWSNPCPSYPTICRKLGVSYFEDITLQHVVQKYVIRSYFTKQKDGIHIWYACSSSEYRSTWIPLPPSLLGKFILRVLALGRY